MNSETIPVTRSSLPSFDEYIEEIRPLWDSRWLTNAGCKHKEFENAIKRYLGVESVTLFVNGHAALESAIEGLGIGEDGRRKVITTPFTFASTTHAIVRRGLEPVFADIKLDDYTLDPLEIAKLAEDPQVGAIVPVHVYGNICDVASIDKIAKKNGLKVIYDAAHAFGVSVGNTSVAEFGDASVFSFHATKVFNSIEGGAVCGSDESLSHKLNYLKNFGINEDGDCDIAGMNGKMNEFCSAMGICNLRHLDSEIEKRRAIAYTYCEYLDGLPGVKMSMPRRGTKPNFAYFPVLFDPVVFGMSRDDVFDVLLKAGVVARRYFYPLTSNLKCYHGRSGFEQGRTPIASWVSENILTLPLFADLSVKDARMICRVIRESKA